MTTLEFLLPDVGEGIATADILLWKVAEGDHVEEGQELVEIQTDKAAVVIPAPAAGRVARLGAREGDSLDVGAVLAVIEIGDDDDAARAAAHTPAADPAPAVVAAAAALPSGGSDVAGASGPLAAPATRQLARELGVVLADVAGSGPQGRITRDDVERAAAGAQRAADGAPGAHGAGAAAASLRAAPTRPGTVVPMRAVRRSIAHTLTRAWQEVPRVIDYREVDASALMRARDSLRRRARDHGDEELARALTPTPLIAKAAVQALRDHPYANASIDLERDEITLHGHYHLGIATAAPDGLMVPVVHDADHRTLADIALEIAELSRAARERRLRPEQLAGATSTVNNYGGLGIWLGTPIVRPPEVVNLGVGAVRDRVVALDGVAVVRPTLVLAVAGDHRVLDGDTLAAFVTQVTRLLEDPVLLFEELR